MYTAHNWYLKYLVNMLFACGTRMLEFSSKISLNCHLDEKKRKTKCLFIFAIREFCDGWIFKVIWIHCTCYVKQGKAEHQNTHIFQYVYLIWARENSQIMFGPANDTKNPGVPVVFCFKSTGMQHSKNSNPNLLDCVCICVIIV